MTRAPFISACTLLTLALAGPAGCGSRAANTVESPAGGAPVEAARRAPQAKETTMQLKGPFQEGALIDQRFTGEGPDRSPPLQWSGTPPGTVSLAIVCDDPDAPSPRRPASTPWVHWVIYNIPPSQTELPEGMPRDAEPQEVPGARQGSNSWDRDNVGYRGPLPPPGSGPHRYFFRIYALDTLLHLKPAQATKTALLKAMQGHILAEDALMGRYERR